MVVLHCAASATAIAAADRETPQEANKPEKGPEYKHSIGVPTWHIRFLLPGTIATTNETHALGPHNAPQVEHLNPEPQHVYVLVSPLVVRHRQQ